MIHCVEQRFEHIRAPRKVQWLTDNGSIFAAYRTLEIAAALNLEPCFTLVESPESNGMAEAFVKTFMRDYVRVNPIPDARTALLRIDHWMEDHNSEHPHSRLSYRSPREYIASLKLAGHRHPSVAPCLRCCPCSVYFSLIRVVGLGRTRRGRADRRKCCGE
jgi:hypothetical protein